jgi:glycosyltransferase involved in cell wall biosynthesis
MGVSARCRVYLFTYRRPELLRRAIKSLLDQTYTSWVCEVHNDDPSDFRPKEVLAGFADPRITLVTHPEKYGPTKTFNCAFVPVSEEFISILEDDNSWDPEFLSSCIDCLDKRPDVSLVWTNMQMWKQIDESACSPTDVFFWQESSKTGAKLPPTTTFPWPNARLFIGGLHSTGAMVLRSKHAADYIVPDECPSNFFEHVRERAFRYPIVLIRKKLANWTWTSTTSRPSGLALSIAIQVMLANSFLLHCKKNHFGYLRIWTRARRRKQRNLTILVFAIVYNICLWPLFRYLKATDVCWLCVDFLKHPFATAGSFRHMRRLEKLWQFVDKKTSERNR